MGTLDTRTGFATPDIIAPLELLQLPLQPPQDINQLVHEPRRLDVSVDGFCGACANLTVDIRRVQFAGLTTPDSVISNITTRFGDRVKELRENYHTYVRGVDLHDSSPKAEDGLGYNPRILNAESSRFEEAIDLVIDALVCLAKEGVSGDEQKDMDQRMYTALLAHCTDGKIMFNPVSPPRVFEPNESRASLGVNDTSTVSQYRNGLREVLKQLQIPNPVNTNIIYTAGEMMANVISHGGGIVWCELDPEGVFRVIANSDSQPDPRIFFRRIFLGNDSDRSSLGVGFKILLAMSDSVIVQLQDGRTVVVVEHNLPELTTPE
ncbi:hypothetical protein KGQ71_04985 [Patescibacteria group bacterium]|nr:hypothetical protein [Patescibacteria group bacterium]